MIKKIKDPVSCITHLVGALLSIAGLVLLVYNGAVNGSAWHVVSFSIFGASLILLYSASTIYHCLDLSEKGNKVLRKIDHIMIYVLIAGTYTPICLIPLRGGWGWSIFGVIWGLAVAGIFLKIFWTNCPRWLYTAFYVAMGWIVIIAFVPLKKAIPMEGIGLLVAGGVVYTLGALIYALKKPNLFSRFVGFHEIFHIFILIGSFCHFWLIFKYI